ncbi:AAA family ATPase [Acetobacterium fimetarium]|uniref:AAA family ATPase n=1 Tax=Acetobacterium fimetarium TaxID=52691 RepID=A0ABR6WUM1_9FIRM|nr:AAA family ATPase [Acetobacterium fimetarium]MBC3804255.1 AAA family ATPase [Acetobacterium fimetarium]
MKRKFEDVLVSWKNKHSRKPALIYGARQIGKTTSIKSFGEKYFENMIYINFELNRELAEDFQANISPDFLIHRFEVYFGEKINQETTLIVFDEIQACERALTSLKYFCEDAPEYYIIGAGSLLGVALKREDFSFPVGKVNQIHMYPMDFEEFLWAKNQKMLADEIRVSYEKREPMDLALHKKAMGLYREYLIVGGMPEAVKEYTENNSLLEVAEIQGAIINAYVADMAKYATPGDTTKIMACFDSLPAQLAKDNKKFQYKVVARGGRASLFGASIDWLLASGIVIKCERVDQGQHPLAIFKDIASFKLYMGDVGLLSHRAGVNEYDIIKGNDHVFIGALTENYVANALTQKGYPLYYWTSGTSEVDFMIENQSDVFPIEVKARENVKSRSLSVYVKLNHPNYSMRISGKNFGFENDILSIPLYAVFCL